MENLSAGYSHPFSLLPDEDISDINNIDNNHNNNNNNELRTQLPVQHCGYMQHRVGCQRSKLFCKDMCHFNAHKHEDFTDNW